jgi:hypothetical protein
LHDVVWDSSVRMILTAFLSQQTTIADKFDTFHQFP